jgi:thiol-disulfide isomerase/thioredoxin
VSHLSARRLVAGSAGVAAATLLAIGLALHAPTGRHPAPPLPRSVLSGKRVTVTELRGHGAAIAFVASWCGPCHAEAAALESFASSAAGRGHLVAVDYADYGDVRGELIAPYHWTFPVLSDQSGATGDAYGVLRLPTTVILNAAGEIVARDSGSQTVASLRRAVASAG